MDLKLVAIIKSDIEKCEKAQNTRNGSQRLYQALIAKYNGIFDDFEKDIPKSGKMSTIDTEFDYRPELNAIKEKLEINLALNKDEDPLLDFKIMFDEDLKALNTIVADINEFDDTTKLNLYKEITAKYHTCIPKLGTGLYGYYEKNGFYEDISGESLNHNLKQIHHKMNTFKSLNYPTSENHIQTAPMVQITNKNENSLVMNVTFNQVRKEIEDMTSLTELEIREIMTKISELERIINSSDRKTKKWENAKGIIKWIADKGVDVGIALLPLLLQLK